MGKFQNITVAEFIAFLSSRGLSCIRKNGGHEIWAKDGMDRPIVIQSHIDPIPEFILKNNLRLISVSKKEFLAFFDN